MNSEENRQTYVRKMGRQIKDWRSKIKDLEKHARKRDAGKNTVIKRDLDNLHQQIADSRSRLGDVKAGKSDWAQKARSASADYRRMKATAEDLGARIKRK